MQVARSAELLAPAPLPSVIVVDGATAPVGEALASAFAARVVRLSDGRAPSNAAVCVSVGAHDGRHRPRCSIGDFSGPIVLVGSRCAPGWSPTSGSLLIVPAASSTGDELLAHAARWSSVLGTPVWLTTVVDGSLSASGGDMGRTDLLASGLLNRMSRQLSAMGIDAGWDVLYGRNAPHAIRSFSSDPPVSLIVMEAPRPLTRRSSLWMAARAVAREATVPVLLLPATSAVPRALPSVRPAVPRPMNRPATRRGAEASRPLAAPPASRWRARTAVATVTVAVLAVVLCALAQLQVPYDAIGPGDAPSLGALIRVGGATTYPAAGSVRLVTITSSRCTLFDAVRGWIDPDVDVVADHLDAAEAARVWEANRHAMDDAKSTARLVALRRLGYSQDIDVEFDTAHVVGPSGGLAFTLALLEALTPGDLTGDLHVAATGTIDPNGTVGAIGGLRQKVVAARASGVDLLLVPAVQRDDAVAHAHDGLVVVGVGSLSDALDVLRDRGGDPLPTQPVLVVKP